MEEKNYVALRRSTQVFTFMIMFTMGEGHRLRTFPK
jgi:hypothetical protein